VLTVWDCLGPPIPAKKILHQPSQNADMKKPLHVALAVGVLSGIAAVWWLSRDGGPPAAKPAPGGAAGASPPAAPGIPLAVSPGSVAVIPPRAKPEPAPASGTPLELFDAWTQRFLAAGPEERQALEAEGVRLANKRRPSFKHLIQTDPREALARAVPMVVRQNLPPAIVAQLEERVADRGEIRLYGSSPEAKDNGQPAFVRYVETQSGLTYEAHVYGRREQVMRQLQDVSINGVAMDGQLAVSESPLRRLEVGEVPDPNRPTVEICPISGKTTALTEAPAAPISAQVAAVEVYNEIIYLCDGAHIVPYEQSLILGEAGTGGAQSFTGGMPAASVPSVGVVKVLYVPAVFADQGQVPASEATCHDVLRQVADFYQTQSFGRLTLVATVTPPVKLPRNQAWYKGKDTIDGFVKEVDGLNAEMTHAKEAARAAGYDWQDYHCFVVRANGGARAPTSFGSIGAGQVWMRNDSVSTVAHEVGHAFGLLHANFWLTNGASVAGPGGNEEYGDIYDNMGSASPPAAHYNAQAKNQVKWLPDEFAPPITQSGQYRIHAFDTPRIEPGKLYGLRVIKDAERIYWGEFRTLFSTNTWVSNGLLLGWKWSQNSGGNIQLLDTTPGSINGKSDAPIGLGATFSDYEAGIHVTTLAVNPATSPPSLDVQVHLGDFPANQPPALTLTPAKPVVPTNSPVSFTATASDPDGDALAYSWRWHDDIISPNSATVSRTFSSNGIFTVSCVVSDMKGGTAVRNAVVTVGTGGGRFTISGRITKGGVGLAGLNVSTSGSNGTLTDSDGYYTISNLTAGAYTVTPAGHGFQFNELFNNSITVGPSFSGANFEVDDLPVVTVTAPVPTAIEGASPTPGSFRLARTGPTGLPLTVSTLVARGTANKTGIIDYTFSPDYTAIANTPYFTFTIPADQSFLDIAVTPVNDILTEGDETVQLILGMDAAYLNGTPATATVTIQDDDTALPRVFLTSSLQQISENAEGSMVCTLTRSGSTASSLPITYSLPVTNTATNGADYVTLSGAATIPAGATSTSFLVTPVNDAEAEATERLTISISTTGTYIADTAANAVNLRIVDDDTQVVTLTTPDNLAREADRSAPGAVTDPGTFLVTRTGDTSQPLTVYYSVAGRALHGVDYEPLPGSVVLAAGQTQAPIIIMPRPDPYDEAAETVVLSLAAGNGGYQLGSPSSGTVTIQEFGGKPLLEVMASSAIAAEPSSNGTFRITAKGTGVSTVTVNYTVSGTATSGIDYTALSGSTTITLNSGIATRDITVAVLNDATPEEMETVILTLSPSPDYALWESTQSATLLIRDDDQPTVFADPQVGTGFTNVIAENITTTTCKFWISRTGATTSALTVNYSLVGTATNGTDHTTLSGVATIPVGAPGVDVSFNTINDSLFEGTETVIVHLEPGAYARGPDAVLYITDDESGPQAIAFATPGGSGSESQTSVNIPVTLTSPATTPVTVEYALETGARTPAVLQGSWVRVVRTGTSFQTFTSTDGLNWTSSGTTRTINMSSASYLAGIAVTSGSNGGSALVHVDNVSITNLSGGGSMGSRASADVGSVNPAAAYVESGGLYEVFTGGPDIASTGTTDVCRFIYFPITNSANCTVTARVLNYNTSSTLCRAGVMIRETSANDARHFSMLTYITGAVNQVSRATAGAASVNQSLRTQATMAKPGWCRLTRVGDVISAFVSSNGTTFTQIGVEQNIPLNSQLLVGLAVSSRADGTLAQATFDNVTIDPAPAAGLTGRDIGFVNEPGGVSVSGGVYTITGSGTGFIPGQTSTEDEGYMVGVPVSGDFSITARLIGFTAAPTTSQAGLVVRESANYRARTISLMASSANTTMEFRGRFSSTTSGEGLGVDYRLNPGILNFGIGDLTKNIVLNVTDDLLPEPAEFLTIALKFPYGAMLGPQSTYTYSIIDNDSPDGLLPAVGIAGETSTVVENVGVHLIPVVLSATSAAEVLVDFTATGDTATGGGVDYDLANGTLAFAPGETLKFISLPVIDDSIMEVSEYLTLSLSNPVNAVVSNSGRVVAITDNDLPVVTVVASDSSANEAGDPGEFTFYRTGNTDAPLTVFFNRSGTATSGSDFTAFSPANSITIPAGQATVALTVAPLQNTSPEVAETVIVTLASGDYVVGSPSSATVTIDDDDVNTITLTATDPTASEAGSNPGEFTLTRAGPTSAALTVIISITGTATNGSDYNTISTSRVFAIGQTAVTIPVTVIQDSLTEGDEEVVVSIASSANYLTGSPSVANVTIIDDDLPPSVFVSSPASKSTIINAHNGLMLQATGTDDGLPNPLTYQWTQLFGPGTVTFANSASAGTAAVFSAPGVYGLRVTVDDGQFTATDDIIVQAGGFSFGTWVGSDQGPPGVRGISGESSGTFTLIGSGSGYSTLADSGHMMFRQLLGGSGDCTIIARLSSLTGPSTRIAGITVRDTSWKGARRVNLLLDGAGTLQFRQRATQNSADTSTNVPGFASPRWLKLERSGGTVTASHANDVGGQPGSWNQVGSAAITMNSNIVIGMVVSAGAAGNATATAVFDNVSVSPAFTGSALHSEDLGNYTLAGDSSEAGGVVTINAVGSHDGTGSHFRYQQIWGDCIITARLTSHSGTTRGAQSGVAVRDTTDNGPFGFYGTTTIDGFQAHWRSSTGGTPGTLQTGGSVGNWIRLVRKGNNVSAFRAANVGSAPGTWTQVTGNLPAPMTGPMLVGLLVDSNSSSLVGTGTFTGLEIEPLNTAPVIAIGSVPDVPPFNLTATVTDDGKPTPPGNYSLQWSQVAGPGLVSFAPPTSASTLATLSDHGAYTLRLTADDGEARTFGQTSVMCYLSRYAKWQDSQFAQGLADPAAYLHADPDADGLSNLMEYAFVTGPNAASASPVVRDTVTVGPDRFLRLTVPKNPDAPELIYQVQATSDLTNPGSWSSAGLVIEQNNSSTLRVRDSIPMTGSPRRFMRVWVSMP
jgi:hypothetical protein